MPKALILGWFHLINLLVIECFYSECDLFSDLQPKFPLVFCVQLEEVMETETYKTAKLILERFDPEAKNRHVSEEILDFFYMIYLPAAMFLFVFYLCLFCRDWSRHRWVLS